MAGKKNTHRVQVETDPLDEVAANWHKYFIDTTDDNRDTKPRKEDSKVVMFSSLHLEAPSVQAYLLDPARRWLSEGQPVC